MRDRRCCVCGITTKQNCENSRSFFKLPNSPERKKIWIKRLGIEASKTKTSFRVCNAHFPNNQLESCRCRLKRKAMPFCLVGEEDKENQEIERYNKYSNSSRFVHFRLSSIVPKSVRLSVPTPPNPGGINLSSTSALQQLQHDNLMNLNTNTCEGVQLKRSKLVVNCSTLPLIVDQRDENENAGGDRHIKLHSILPAAGEYTDSRPNPRGQHSSPSLPQHPKTDNLNNTCTNSCELRVAQNSPRRLEQSQRGVIFSALALSADHHTKNASRGGKEDKIESYTIPAAVRCTEITQTNPGGKSSSSSVLQSRTDNRFISYSNLIESRGEKFKLADRRSSLPLSVDQGNEARSGSSGGKRKNMLSSIVPEAIPCTVLTQPIPQDVNSSDELQHSSELLRKLKTVRQQNRRLKSKIRILQTKRNLQKNMTKVEQKSPSFFSWIKKTFERYGKHKTATYSMIEKTTALKIFYACGQKGYRTLQGIGLKLPALGTLKQWVAPLDLQTGLNLELLELLREWILEMREDYKDCVIVWDEMSIKECLQYDKFRDKFEGIEDLGEDRRTLNVATEVLVVMVSSIKGGWKFPISFYFSKSNTTSEALELIIKENVTAMQEVGLRIRIGICDMSFTNQGLYRRLGVSLQQPHINVNGQKIIMIHDVPHLLKLFRNNLMTKTFFYSCGSSSTSPKKSAKWKYLREFYNNDIKLASRMAPKLSKHHINVKDFSKMKVKLASQLFSHSVYAGIKTMIELGIMSIEAEGTCTFIRMMDELFDLLNISKEKDNKQNRSASFLASNVDIFDKYIEFIHSLEVSNNSKKPDCFYGMELTLVGIKVLIQDLKTEGYQYVLTRRLQQDCLENLFSFIRSKGGWCKNPTARQFRQNFMFVFITSMIRQSDGTNCQAVNDSTSPTDNLATLSKLFKIKKKDKIFQPPLTSSSNDIHELELEEASLDLYSKQNYSQSADFNVQDANVANYMACYAVKAVAKQKNCKTCKNLLTGKLSSENPTHQLILNKAYNKENLEGCFSNIAYGDMVSDEISNVFLEISKKFLDVANATLKVSGENVAQGILSKLKELENVRIWLEGSDAKCKEHINIMLRLFTRAKLFRLVKDVNEKWSQTKSWQQTRKDMRNQ